MNPLIQKYLEDYKTKLEKELTENALTLANEEHQRGIKEGREEARQELLETLRKEVEGMVKSEPHDREWMVYHASYNYVIAIQSFLSLLDTHAVPGKTTKQKAPRNQVLVKHNGVEIFSYKICQCQTTKQKALEIVREMKVIFPGTWFDSKINQGLSHLEERIEKEL